jgi:hypothetical protein
MTLAIGDRVKLVKLDDWFFNDLEPDTKDYLRSCIGVETEVVGFDENGHAELEFLKSRVPFIMHTVWVDPSWLEKV